MKTIRSINAMRRFSASAKKAGRRIGFVPTMGALHDGHASLIKAAKRDCDSVVVSIFVNPIQFGPREDFKKYPRNIAKDKEMLSRSGVDALFLPSAREVFKRGFSTSVEVPGISDALCGKTRPGHFRGVATIVAKLFNIVAPDIAYFGLKDFQQFTVIKRMVRDLNFNIRLVGLPTVREKNGLAMSSRNRYLSSKERSSAAALYSSLKLAKLKARRGERSVQRIKKMITDHIISKVPGARIDYVEVCEPGDLLPIKIAANKAVILLAVRVGAARLIDNIII